MKIIATVLLGLSTLALNTTEPTQTPTIIADKKAPAVTVDRTIHIDKVITGDFILGKAEELNQLAASSKEPINLIINSPGGSVFAGLLFINSMIAAQAEGIKIRCYVPGMAASMAFQIYIFCDERYALEYSMLLWHPPRISGYMTLTPKKLQDMSERMNTLEKELVGPLMKKLYMIPKKVFLFHYHNETFHLGTELNKLTSGRFLSIVKTMPGVDLGTSARKMLEFKKTLEDEKNGRLSNKR